VSIRSTKKSSKYIVLGASAGGVHALKTIIKGLSPAFDGALILVMHRLKNVESRLDQLFQSFTQLPVTEVEDKQDILPRNIYLAPANYHLLAEEEGTFALSVSERVNFSRPSIDVTFVSFAEAFGDQVYAILLTGANEDGAAGLRIVREKGGTCVVQHIETAQVAVMPRAGLAAVPDALELHLEEIIDFINRL
jgi:two-component system chemotaxis response regulator CheB